MVFWVVIAACGVLQPPHGVPSNDPELTNPAVEDRLAEQQRKVLNTTPIEPQAKAAAQSPIPGIAPPRGVTLSITGRTHHAEGSFLSPVPGTIRRASTGDVIFEPAAPAEGSAEPTFILMPCSTLTDILAGDEGSGLAIGGQVFEYRGRPYLLPTIFSHHTTAPAVPSAPAPTTTIDPNPTAADLIRDLEAGIVPRTIVPLEAAAEERTRGDTGAPADEGKLLVNRRARIVRLPGADGRFAATFDNDPNSPTQRPMVLLPCRALERLESTASFRGENAAYTISGRLYAFGGQSYLLPVLVQVQRQTDVTPMQ